MLLTLCASLMFISSCIAQRPARGGINQPSLGHHSLDFFFEDEHGHLASLGLFTW